MDWQLRRDWVHDHRSWNLFRLGSRGLPCRCRRRSKREKLGGDWRSFCHWQILIYRYPWQALKLARPQVWHYSPPGLPLGHYHTWKSHLPWWDPSYNTHDRESLKIWLVNFNARHGYRDLPMTIFPKERPLHACTPPNFPTSFCKVSQSWSGDSGLLSSCKNMSEGYTSL